MAVRSQTPHAWCRYVTQPPRRVAALWSLSLVLSACITERRVVIGPGPQTGPEIAKATLVVPEPCRVGAPLPGVFTESAAALGINFTYPAFPPSDLSGRLQDFPAVAVADLDGDGALDLFFANSAGPDQLYLTTGRGPAVFRGRDRASDPEASATRAVAAADLDGDGDRDLILAAADDRVLIAANRGDATFDPPTALRLGEWAAGMTFSNFSLALGDVDSDGWLDLVVGNQTERLGQDGKGMPGREWLFRGSGLAFDDVSHWLPKRPYDDLTFLASFIDLDDDGDLDLYEINDARPLAEFGVDTSRIPGVEPAQGNRLYENRGLAADGRVVLVDVTVPSGAGVVIAGMGGAIGDYDNDGRPDLYVTTMPLDANALLHNEGGLRFVDRTVKAQANTLTVAHDVGWGAVFFDADLDGWIDLFVVHGFKEGSQSQSRRNRDDQSNVLLRNVDGVRFDDVTEAAGVQSGAWSRSPVVGDLNRDGFPDLVVGNADSPPFVYLNGCDERPWLTVKLSNTGPNTDGIQARVRATAGGVTQSRWILAGGDGLYGSSAPEAYFGFALGVEVVDVEVRWPDGQVDSWSELPVRRIATLRR